MNKTYHAISSSWLLGREIFGTECRSKRRKKEENDARGKTFGTGKVTQKKMIVSWVFDLREKLKKEQGQIFERNYFGSDQEHTEKRWWIQKKMIFIYCIAINHKVHLLEGKYVFLHITWKLAFCCWKTASWLCGGQVTACLTVGRKPKSRTTYTLSGEVEASVREGSSYQIRWFFRKVPKGVGAF